MDLWADKRGLFIILLLLFLSTFALAREARVGSGENASMKSSDHCTKMFLISSRRAGKSGGVGLPVGQDGAGLFDAFFASLSMILVSEIGDETFILATLIAMQQPKSIILSGALSAYIVMTVLSTRLGRIVPNLISRKHTNNGATVLYLFFGLRLMYIAWRSHSKSSQKKEIEEEEEKLEAGQRKSVYRLLLSRFCTPIFLETFILTFLAERGDCCQIATIALATHKNVVRVAVGATLGHTRSTSVAVVGGSLLASKISQRTVATIDGLLFLGFSVSSFFYPPL